MESYVRPPVLKPDKSKASLYATDVRLMIVVLLYVTVIVARNAASDGVKPVWLERRKMSNADIKLVANFPLPLSLTPPNLFDGVLCVLQCIAPILFS